MPRKYRSALDWDGGRIKELRLKAGMSQIEFAEVLGVNQSQVSLLESGKRHISNQTMKLILELNSRRAFVKTYHLLPHGRRLRLSKRKEKGISGRSDQPLSDRGFQTT
jgi:transcriptional regulator with XRE-family HTH domain